MSYRPPPETVTLRGQVVERGKWPANSTNAATDYVRIKLTNGDEIYVSPTAIIQRTLK